MVKKYETAFGTIYNADSKRILEFVDEDSVDLVYTDPPYGIDYEKYSPVIKRGNEHVNFGKDDDIAWMKEFPFWMFEPLPKAMKDDRWGFVWHAIEMTSYVREAIEKQGMKIRNEYIWYKHNVAPTPRSNFKNAFQIATVFTKGRSNKKWRGGGNTPNVIQMPFVSHTEWKEAGGHPSIKPVKLVLKHIPLFTDKGDLVLDMFAGSGSIPVACEILQRRWVAFEIEEKWFDVIVKRIKKYENKRLDDWIDAKTIGGN